MSETKVVTKEPHIIVLKDDLLTNKSTTSNIPDGSIKISALNTNHAAVSNTNHAAVSNINHASIINTNHIIESIKNFFHVDVHSSYHHIFKGFSTVITNDEAKIISSHPDVKEVIKDVKINLMTQTIPWGVLDIRSPLFGIRSKDSGGDVSDAGDNKDNKDNRDNKIIKNLQVDVDVYVVDSGVESNHPNLNVVENISMVQPTFSIFPSSSEPLHGHATHIAGTIGAIDDGNTGVVGVAPGARIHSIQVFDSSGDGLLSYLLAGIDFLLKRSSELSNSGSPTNSSNSGSHGVIGDTPLSGSHGVIGNPPLSGLPTNSSNTPTILVNMSLGVDLEDSNLTYLDNAIQYAADRGIIFVVAAGNSSRDVKFTSPAHSSKVITVASYDKYGSFSSFSNFGSKIDICAPGEEILSTWVNGSYAILSGTSMASPHITGAIALYLSKYKNATISDIRRMITSVSVNRVKHVPYGTTSMGIRLPDDFAFARTFLVKMTLNFLDKKSKDVEHKKRVTRIQYIPARIE